MGNGRRAIARIQLQNRLLRSNGQEFGQLFGMIMAARYPAFKKVQPYGRIGDGGNDGYEPTKGIYYQVYAPTTTSDTIATAATKASTDFGKLKKHWESISAIQEFKFVYRDNSAGSILPLEQALSAIQKDHDVVCGQMGFQEVLNEAMSLDIEELEQILGQIIPDVGLLQTIEYTALREVVEFLLREGAPAESNGRQLTPAFLEKIKINGLSPHVAALLSQAALQTGEIENFFQQRDPYELQDLRDHVAAQYAAAKESDVQPTSSDGVYFDLLARVTPPSQQLKRPVQDAARVVLAYFFESCDVFEGPNAST